MKKWMVICACALAHSLAQAATPTEETIERLLEVAEAKKLNESVVINVKESLKPIYAMMGQALEGRPDTDGSLRKAQANLQTKLDALIQSELSWDRMKKLSGDVYRESFTQEEVEGLIKFYESPAGRALVVKMPIVVKKILDKQQARIGPMQSKMMAIIGEAMDELGKPVSPSAAGRE